MRCLKMERNNFIWVLECCLLSLDGVSKKDMISFGASEELAEMGIQLCNYLNNKEVMCSVL